MKDLRTIVLAAGKGTRMKSETPKVLHKVSGCAIISYVLDIVKSIGSLKTYVVVGHGSQQVKNFLPKDIETVLQKKLLGTADAVRSVESKLRNFRGDVLILCGDTPLLKKQTIQSLVRKHRISKAVCTFLTASVNNPDGYGRIIRSNDNRVEAIREHKDASKEELNISEVNVGVYCIDSKKLFQALKTVKLNPKKKEFYLTDTIEFLVQKSYKIETVTTEDFFEGLGVNDREDLAMAEDVIRHRILTNLMISGVTIVDPETTFIEADVKIGTDTIIRPFTLIEKDVVIGKHCLIGPFARIRSKSRIADRVEVGNFTEVNRTRIGSGTLMKHFSYLGDAILGKDVNIGAGTVTANFDGKNKNDTYIADGAFIGSDSVLIAPVKIGKKAMVGAGSVLTRGKNVPDKRTVVGVPARIIK